MNGRVTQLPPAQAEALRGAGQVGGGSGDMPVGSWIRKAHTAAGGTVGGVKTDRVVATLDAGAALRDIFAAVRAAGNRAPRIDADAERELRRSVDESRLELWSGADDKLLRRLWVRIGFKADVPQGLRRSLGELVGGRLRFDIDLSELNRPVKVTAPPGQPS
jgi:hypothetical protein